MSKFGFRCVIREPDPNVNLQYRKDRDKYVNLSSFLQKLVIEIPYLDTKFTPDRYPQEEYEESVDSEEDAYKPPRVDEKKYQVAIPQLVVDEQSHETELEDEWVGEKQWVPCDDEAQLESFLSRSKVDIKYDLAGNGTVPDKSDDATAHAIRENLLTEEEVLIKLYESNFNYSQTAKELTLSNQFWSAKKKRMALWKPEEKEILELIFQKYEKDFLWIAREKLAATKTRADIIHYYYLYKKTPRPSMPVKQIKSAQVQSNWEKRKNAPYLNVSQESFSDHHVVPSRVNGRLRNKSRKDYSKDLTSSPQKTWLDGPKRKLERDNAPPQHARSTKRKKPNMPSAPAPKLKLSVMPICELDFPTINEIEDVPRLDGSAILKLLEISDKEENFLNALTQLCSQSKYYSPCFCSEIIHEWRLRHKISLDQLLDLKLSEVTDSQVESLSATANAFCEKLTTLYQAYLGLIKKRVQGETVEGEENVDSLMLEDAAKNESAKEKSGTDETEGMLVESNKSDPVSDGEKSSKPEKEKKLPQSTTRVTRGRTNSNVTAIDNGNGKDERMDTERSNHRAEEPAEIALEEDEDGPETEGEADETAPSVDAPKKRKKVSKTGKYLPKPKRKGKGKRGPKPKNARAKEDIEENEEEMDEVSKLSPEEAERRHREDALAPFRAVNLKEMKVKQLEEFVTERDILQVYCQRGSCFKTENLEKNLVTHLFFKMIPKIDFRSLKFLSKLNFRLENCLNFDELPSWFVHYMKTRKTFEFLIEDEDEQIDIDDFIDSLSASDDDSADDEDIADGYALNPVDRATYLFLTSLHRLSAQYDLGKDIGTSKCSNSKNNGTQNNHNGNLSNYKY